MPIVDPFKKKGLVDPFKDQEQTQTQATAPSIEREAPTTYSKAPVLEKQEKTFADYFPAVSHGIEELIGPKNISTEPWEVAKMVGVGQLEMAHAAIAPLIHFFVGMPVAGLVAGPVGALRTGSLEGTSKSIESAMGDIEKILHLNRQYRNPFATGIRGAIGTIFGGFEDIGNLVGDGLLKVGVDPGISSSAATAIKTLPLLMGVKSQARLTKEAQLKIQSSTNVVRDYLIDKRIEDFARENIDNLKSDLADAYKQATVEGDVAKIEKIKQTQERVSYIYDILLKKDELKTEDVVEKPQALESVKTAKIEEDVPVDIGESAGDNLMRLWNSGKISDKLKVLDIEIAKNRDSIIADSRMEAKVNGIKDWTPEKAIDEYYKRALSTGTKTKLQKGETWRGRLEKYAELENQTNNIKEVLGSGYKVVGSGPNLSNFFGSDVGAVGKDINKTIQDVIAEGNKRLQEAKKELLTIEDEIKALKEEAKKAGGVEKSRALSLAGKRKEALDKIDSLKMYEELSLPEEMDLKPEEVMKEEVVGNKADVVTGQTYTLKDLQEKGKTQKMDISAVVGHNNSVVYEVKQNGSTYILPTLKSVDDMISGKKVDIKKETKAEVAKKEEIVEDATEKDILRSKPLAFAQKSKIIRERYGLGVAEAAAETKRMSEMAALEKKKFTTLEDVETFLDEIELTAEPSVPAKASQKVVKKKEEPRLVKKEQPKAKVVKSVELTKEQKAKIPELVSQWKSAKKIAEELGVDVELVRKARDEAGIPSLSDAGFKQWRKDYKKEKGDPVEQKRESAIAKTKEETPEQIPEETLASVKAEIEKRNKQQQDHFVESDSVSADSDFTILKNEPMPELRAELVELAAEFYGSGGGGKFIDYMIGKDVPEKTNLFGNKKEQGIMGLSHFFNLMRENMMRIESRTGVPLSKLFFEIQDGIRQEHLLSVKYRKRLAEARKGMTLANASKIYKLLEVHGFDEKALTYEKAMDFINNDKLLLEKFGDLTEKEFNAAKELGNILFESGTEFGIPFDRMLKDYAPRIREKGMTFEEAGNVWKNPELFKWWAEEQREGYLMPHEENIFRVVDAYIVQGARKKALGEQYAKFSSVVEAANKKKTFASTEYETLQSFMRSVKNYPGAWDAALRISSESMVRNLNNLIDMLPIKEEKLHRNENITYKRDPATGQLVEYRRDPGFINMDDIAGRFVNWHLTSTYAGALIRPIALVRNMMQPFLTVLPIVDASSFAHGMSRALTKKGMKEAKAAGVLLDDYLPAAGEIEAGIGGKLQSFAEWGLTPYGKVDNLNRSIAFHSMKDYVEKHGKQFYKEVKGAKNVKRIIEMRDKFLDDSELTFFHPIIIRDHFIPLLKEGNLEALSKVAGRFLADETQFVYRRANSPMMMQGKIGKVFGQFLTYPIWYTSYLKHLFERGSNSQKAKRLAGLIATNTIIQEMGDKLFGVNIQKWLWWHPVMWAGGIGQTLLTNIGKFIRAKTETGDAYEEAKAGNEIKNAALMHIPAYLFANDLIRGYEEQDLADKVKRSMGLTPSN